jgi:hypothetical protein
MQRAKGIGLIVLGIFLCSVVIAMSHAQRGSQLSHWLTAMGGLLILFDVGLDAKVLSLCGCATLISGFLLLTNNSSKGVIAGWQLVRFLLHLAAIYTIAAFCTPRLAAWTRTSLLPLLKRPTSSSSFQFLFSHIFEFSFIPAVIAGLTNIKFKHKTAQYVWIVPAIVLAYEFFTFPQPTRSVLDSAASTFPNFSSAFHEYFGCGFLIGDYRDWGEFWRTVTSNPDMVRGMTQLNVTAPSYAGVGYSLAAWIALRFDVRQKFIERIRDWQQSRVDPSSPE